MPSNSLKSFEISKHDPLYMEDQQYAREDIRFHYEPDADPI